MSMKSTTNRMPQKVSGQKKVPQHKKISEHMIEQHLVDEVKKQGGWAPKFVAPGTNGMPDRIVLMPGTKPDGGHIGFVELKAPGEKPRPLQLYRHQQLRDLGFQVFVMDDFDQAQMIIDAIRGEGR